jgi:GTPase SAR1 family protein
MCEECAKNLKTHKCPTCREEFTRYSKNYSLAAIVEKPRQLRDYQTLFKICIVGESGVGKTSILNSFVGGQFEEYTQTTIGLGFRYVSEEFDGKAYKFEMWDTGGQEKYRAMTRSHYKSSITLI